MTVRKRFLESDQGKVTRRLDVIHVLDHPPLCEEVSVLHGLLIGSVKCDINHNHRKLSNSDRRENGVHDSSADGEIFWMDVGRTHEVGTEAWIFFGNLQKPILSEALSKLVCARMSPSKCPTLSLRVSRNNHRLVSWFLEAKPPLQKTNLKSLA